VSKFWKVTLLVVLALLFVSGDAWAFGREVFEITATVPVVGAQTNAVVNVERGGRVTLDASASAVSGTFSWRFLGGPLEPMLFASNSLAPYFRAIEHGVYRFVLDISDDTSKEITVEVRDLHFVQIQPHGWPQMWGIATYPVAYPRDWPVLYETQAFAMALTTDNPSIDIRGIAGLHTVTLKAKNLATGVEYTAVLIEDNGRIEFSFHGIALQAGDNLVKVIGMDDLGVKCYDARFITYNPSINFIRSLRLSPGHVIGGEERDVEFSLQVGFEEGYPIPENISLYEATSSGELVRRIGELTLRGAPEQGIYYSTVLTVRNVTEDKYYRVIFADGQKSVTERLSYIPKLSMDREERARRRSIISSVQREILIDAGRVHSWEEFDRRIEKMAEILNNREDVKYVYINRSGRFSRREVFGTIRVAFTSMVGSTGFSVYMLDDDIEYNYIPFSSLLY